MSVWMCCSLDRDNFRRGEHEGNQGPGEHERNDDHPDSEAVAEVVLSLGCHVGNAVLSVAGVSGERGGFPPGLVINVVFLDILGVFHDVPGESAGFVVLFVVDFRVRAAAASERNHEAADGKKDCIFLTPAGCGKIFKRFLQRVGCIRGSINFEEMLIFKFV